MLVPHREAKGYILRRCLLVASSDDVGQQTNAAESAALCRISLASSLARATVGDVMVLLLMTNISMAVLFVVPEGGPHMKVTSSEHTR